MTKRSLYFPSFTIERESLSAAGGAGVPLNGRGVAATHMAPQRITPQSVIEALAALEALKAARSKPSAAAKPFC